MQPPAAATYACTCSIRHCRIDCGIEVTDELLRATGDIRGDEVDHLLDLRSLLRRRANAEEALRLFCQLRRAMEERHYLAFYRLRRWLTHHLEARVTLHSIASHRTVSVPTDWYCVEAIRHHCLRLALTAGESPSDGRVEFAFRSLESFGEASASAPSSQLLSQTIQV